MDGFYVDATALSEISLRYCTASEQLSYDADKLRRARQLLSTQKIPGFSTEFLDTAIRDLEASLSDVRELGVQCEEIADVYIKTERLVASVVALLPSVSPFTASSPDNYQSSQEAFAADSLFRTVKPILLSGNRLPSESWLLSRAIKASLGGEK